MPPMGLPLRCGGCLQPGRKGSHLPPGTTKLGKLRDGHDSATASTAKPDLGFSSLLGECWKCGAHPGMAGM